MRPIHDLRILITNDDIARIERVPVVAGPVLGGHHRSVAQADPRLQHYIEVVRQGLDVDPDADAHAMMVQGIPSAGDIVEHLAERGVARFHLFRPRGWKPTRIALREVEGE